MDKLPRPRRSGFYKGIDGFTVRTEAGLLSAAQASIYMWWWRFMRLNPVFWYADKHKIEPANANIKRAYELAGNLRLADFETWWNRHGQYVFEENQLPAKVEVIDVDRFRGHKLYQKSLVVEIPLTITVNKIVNDLKKILADIEYTTDALTVIANSKALLKLKTKRYSLSTIENEYWVFLYRIIYPDAKDWQIADRLKLSPSTRINYSESSQIEHAFTRGRGPIAKLQALGGRNLHRARALSHNLLMGTFPDYTPIPSESRSMPFGRIRHREFLEATDGNNEHFTAWQRYVSLKHKKELHDHILKKNRLVNQYEQDPLIRELFEEYVAGRTNII